LLPRAHFVRIVKKLIENQHQGSLRIQASALAALQEMTEHLAVLYFELLYIIRVWKSLILFSQKIAIHAKRMTIKVEDSDLLRDIVRAIEPSHPFARASRLHNTTLINTKLAERRKWARWEERFEERRHEKAAKGLYPKWKAGVPVGWTRVRKPTPPPRDRREIWYEKNLPGGV